MKGELLKFGVDMSVSSISGKLTDKAVNFMKALFRQVLSTRFNLGLGGEGLSRFSDIIIADSSVFNLHPKCAWHFAGFGGGASESAAKVQFSFGLLTSKVYELLVREGTEGDAGHRFMDIVTNALYLFDLGYFCGDNFKAIAEAGAYFVSRLKYGATIYHLNGTPILRSELDQMVNALYVGQTIDIPVLLGANKLEVRLILHKLPRKIADEIRRKMKSDKQKKCKGMSAGRLAFCDVNAYITNLSPEQLPGHKIREVYGLRWQVEIMFKTWKSGLDMDKVRAIGPLQFQCMFLGKLIKMLLCFKIFWSAKLQLWNQKRIEISESKGMKYIGSLISEIKEWLVGRKAKSKNLLDRIADTMSKTCIKQAKKGDLSPMETIQYYA